MSHRPYIFLCQIIPKKKGKRGILTPISKCSLLRAVAPKPPNRRINPAAARFSKTLMYPSGESIGAIYSLSNILTALFLFLLGSILLENLFHVCTDGEHLLHISVDLLILGVQFSFLS